MCNVTKHGNSPYQVAVIHGGPGACGELAPVAAELAKFCGVLEPMQTATSIQEQVQELKKVLDDNAKFPVTLIGHSWGAWLSFIFAAREKRTDVSKYVVSRTVERNNCTYSIYRIREVRMWTFVEPSRKKPQF